MYSRQSPSPRYRELSQQYELAHRQGAGELDAEEVFDGVSFLQHISRLKRLIERVGIRTMLDYGSGKATAMRDRAAELGLDEIVCYDPGVPEYSAFPADRKFDLVVSTDVMEHIPEEDVPWVIEEMFACAAKAVFANIANYPARKILPNGDNAHVTLRPASWWRDLFSAAAAKYPAVEYECLVIERRPQSYASALMRRMKGKPAKIKEIETEFSGAARLSAPL